MSVKQPERYRPMAQKVLYISPTGGSRYGEQMADILEQARRPDTAVTFVGLPPDRPNHLEYHAYEAMILPDLVRIVRAKHRDYDAIISGGYYDVALRELREISGQTPVIGPCQATTAMASVLANSFSILVGRQKWIPRMSANVRSYGHGKRMASMRAVDLTVHDFHQNPDAAKRLLDLGQDCIERDGAEALILGCTAEYGFASEMQDMLKVPVLEAIPAALKYAEMMADSAKNFGWYPSRKHGSAAPPEEEITAWGLFDGEPPIGREIQIGEEH